MSHPFVERLIGTIRREYLDRILFWTAVDLETKLSEFKDYYNRHRAHTALQGKTPIANGAFNTIARFESHDWRKLPRPVSDTTSSISINSPCTGRTVKQIAKKKEKPISERNPKRVALNRGERIRTSDHVVPNQISILVEVCSKRVDF